MSHYKPIQIRMQFDGIALKNMKLRNQLKSVTEEISLLRSKTKAACEIIASLVVERDHVKDNLTSPLY